MIPSKRSLRAMAAVLAWFVIVGPVADAVAWGAKGHRIVGHAWPENSCRRPPGRRLRN